MQKPNRSYRMTVDYREWSHGDAKCKCSSRWVSVLEQGKNTLGTWYEAPVLGRAFLWFQVAKLIGFTWWEHQYTCTWGFMSGLYKLSCSLLYYSPQELFFFILFFYLWWILSYTEMKQPWVYMCSPSRSPLPPPSPPIPSRFSQCIRSERLSHASNLGWWSVSP